MIFNRDTKTNIILFGDCLELMGGLEPGSIDLICTDLPYGSTYCQWDFIIDPVKMWQEVWKVLKPSGAFVTTAAQPFTSVLITSQLQYFRQAAVWKKSMATGFLDANRKLLRGHEDILKFSKKGYTTYNPQMAEGLPYKGRRGSQAKTTRPILPHQQQQEGYQKVNNTGTRFPTTIIDIPREGNTKHATQKPVALFEYLIKTYSNQGETVLDIAAGSGTTGIAALNTGREYILMEKDFNIFNEAEKRLQGHRELSLDRIEN